MFDMSMWRDALQNAAVRRSVDIAGIEDLLRDLHDDSDVARWVNENVIRSKPLTTEELAFWNHLDHRSEQRRRNDVAQPGDHAPLTEDVLEGLTRNLLLSTRSIQANTWALESQIDLTTSSHISTHSGLKTSNLNGSASVQQETARCQQLSSSNRDIILHLEQDLRSSQGRLARQQKAATARIAEKLKADDRTLEFLEASLLKSVLDDENGSPEANKGKDLVVTLRFITIQQLKIRLDSVYLQELVSARTSRVSDNHASSRIAIDQVEEDMQLLYSEIEDVASMLVENIYANDLSRMERENSLHIAKAEAGNVSEIIDRLKSSAHTANALAKRYESLQNHRHMLSFLDRSVAQANVQSAMANGGPYSTRTRRHSENNQSDWRSLKLSEAHALLRRLNIESSQELLFDDSHPTTVSQDRSKKLVKEDQDLFQNIVISMQQSATAAQMQLDQLNHSRIAGDLSQVSRQIQELDQQIGSAKGESDKETEGVNPNSGHNESCMTTSMHFVEKQRESLKDRFNEARS